MFIIFVLMVLSLSFMLFVHLNLWWVAAFTFFKAKLFLGEYNTWTVVLQYDRLASWEPWIDGIIFHSILILVLICWIILIQGIFMRITNKYKKHKKGWLL